MLDRGVLGSMALYLHKVKLYLQGGVTQEAHKVRLRRDLQRHQVQHNHTQRTDVLFRRTQRVHHKNVLFLQQLNGW